MSVNIAAFLLIHCKKEIEIFKLRGKEIWKTQQSSPEFFFVLTGLFSN